MTLGLRPAGQIYSLNDARQHDWPEGLRRYIETIRQGRGQNPKQYSARYVCSLVKTLFCLLATSAASWSREKAWPFSCRHELLQLRDADGATSRRPKCTSQWPHDRAS